MALKRKEVMAFGALPSEVVSNILGRLDAADLARGKSVCARWRKAGRCVKSLSFSPEAFPEGLSPEDALTVMTSMIMQATHLEHLDITYVSTAGLPDSLLTAWLLSLRPTLVSLKSANIYSFEQTLQGVRHVSIARHVSAHLAHSTLRQLSLSGSELLADVAPMPLLESLELSDVKVTSAGLRKFVSGCERLVSLTLADLDGLNCIELRSSSLRQLSISAEMNSVSFALHLDCPNLQTLELKNITLRGAHIAHAPGLTSLSFADVTGGPIRLQGVGSVLRSIILRGVTWQHVGAAMRAAEGKDVRVLEIDGVTGPDVWMEDDDSGLDTDSDSHMVRPHSQQAGHSPVELDLLSDTEEAFDVESRPQLLSASGGLPGAIAGFQNLGTLRLGAAVWELCCRAGFDTRLARTASSEAPSQGAQKRPRTSGESTGATSQLGSASFSKLRRFELIGAKAGPGVVRSVEGMVGMCPALRKVVLCGELGKAQALAIPPPPARLASSGSRTFIGSPAPVDGGSDGPELQEGSGTSSPTFRAGALAPFPPSAGRGFEINSAFASSDDANMTEADVTAFSSKFASQAMTLQRRFPKLVVDVMFRNSDLQAADQLD